MIIGKFTLAFPTECLMSFSEITLPFLPPKGYSVMATHALEMSPFLMLDIFHPVHENFIGKVIAGMASD